MQHKNQKPEPTTRLRGRPPDTDSGEMQSRLLDTAEALFAEHGFAATPVRQVAEQAGVNPALVHYYFDNKAGLLKAVLDRALAPMAQAIAEMGQEEALDLTAIAEAMFGMAASHPALPRLIVREVLLSAGDTNELFIKHYAPRLGGALPGLVENAQRQGRVDASLDPGIVSLMLLSLCMFPFVAQRVAKAQLNIRFDETGTTDFLAHISQLIQRGTQP